MKKHFEEMKKSICRRGKRAIAVLLALVLLVSVSALTFPSRRVTAAPQPDLSELWVVQFRDE